MFERVIVGWDGAPRSSDALAWLLDRDRGIREVTLLRVFDDLDFPRGSAEGEGLARSAEEALAADVLRLQLEHPEMTVVGEFVLGDREAELHRRAGNGALLVLGSTPRQGGRVRFHWSLGVRLAARVPGAVLVVPEGTTGAAGTIVAGIDGTAASLVAGRVAAGLGAAENRPVVLVHAFQEVGDPDVPDEAVEEARRGSVDYVAPEGPDLLEHRHGDVLEQAASLLRDEFPGVPLETRLVRAAPTEALSLVARGADLLVLGKHGRFDISTWLLGSAAHEMLLRLPLPTLLVGTADLPAGLERVSLVHHGSAGA